MFALAVLLASEAGAQESVAEAARHPEIPSATIAAEDGPGSLWVNPANQAYDPDPRFGLYFDRLTDPGLTSGALAIGGFGQTLGATFTSDGFDPDWSLDASVSVPLPERLALGGTARWHLISDGPSFVAFDLGASLRPTRWLSLSGVLQNIGQPDPTVRVRPTSRFGLALRPARPLVIGVEYAAVYDTRGVDFERLRASLRLRAREGLYLRGFGEVSPDLDDVTAGGALELYVGGFGIGLAGRSDDTGAVGASGWIGTPEPGETIAPARRTVPTVNLTSPPPYEQPAGPLVQGGPTWLEVLDSLQDVEADRRYAGVLLTLSSGLGFARNAELRDRIEALEASGKPVTVFLTGGIDTGAYYAASAASHIVMHPAAVLDLKGISLELTHVRELLDNLGIEAQVVRRAEFKSAAEMLTNSEPSPEQREQLEALLDDVWDELVQSVAAGRGLDEAKVVELVDGGPWLSEPAMEAGLVDAVEYPDQLEDSVGAHLDLRAPRYVGLDSVTPGVDPWGEGRGVAVVYIDGAITSGESSGGGLLSGKSAGSSTVVRQIDRARRDPRVRALVLRVDSPGGSAFASDQITRAVQRFKESEKPVVVSMGSLAASGGYYVSAYADRIYAHPTTITGSIGVISSKVSADRLMAWLGVDITTIDRGKNADMDTSFRSWDEEGLERAQALVDGMYVRFKDHVVAGRSMSAEAVEEVARGRVWSGRAGAGNGLVDELGGLPEAIADARERAGLRDDAPLVVYPPSADLLDVVGSPIPTLRAQRVQLPEPLLAPLGAWATVFANPDEHLWVIEPVVSGLK